MSAHEIQGHADALLDVLASDGDIRDAFTASPLASCADCRQAVEAHLALARRLHALGRAEQDDVRAARAAPAPAPGPAEGILRARILAETRARPRRVPWGWLVGAAAALLVGLLWLRGDEAPQAPDPVLGAGLRLLHPLEEVEAFTPFRWEDEGPGAGWYRIVVFPDGPEDATTTDSGPLRTTSWNPAPEIVAGWGERIRWRLEVYGGAGEGDLVESVSAWAGLSAR